MLSKSLTALVVSTALTCFGAAACSINATDPKAGAAAGANKPDAATATKQKPKTAPKTAGLKELAKPTPPSGATSRGVQSSPQVGGVTVPITDVEVYTFEFDYDESGSDDTVYWAYTEEATYFWVTGEVECGDGSVDPEGAFVMAAYPDGTGSWFFSLGGCPSSDLFGCDFDETGTETACGVCQIDEGALVCAVATDE